MHRARAPGASTKADADECMDGPPWLRACPSAPEEEEAVVYVQLTALGLRSGRLARRREERYSRQQSEPSTKNSRAMTVSFSDSRSSQVAGAHSMDGCVV
eukprot:TRINITY_DN73003_c0_g1_i1.p1 TRINITY_DN73003_c0_g1~~TRINITY_DN73003_c0_g1_i1.p1  ORF type:complete len:100 (-),score=5.08 TRINITY_DN73003_c0_g1_i1:123-422(-)